MNFAVNKRSPLGVKDQIKRQIRILIESGELSSGQALPSARDMAGLLRVNRNTVSSAYKELAEEGFLNIVVGSGTYIAEKKKIPETLKITRILHKAIERAEAQGFTRQQVVDHFVSLLSTELACPAGRRVLVIDCNHEAIEHMSKAIKDEMDVETEGVLIQTLEQSPEKAEEYVIGKDLVVCGFNHIKEFQKVLPESPVEVVAVLLKPDVRLMNEMLRLPPGSRVGYACVNQRSSKTFYENLPFSGGSTITKLWAGMDDIKGLKKMLNQCDIVFATSYIHDRVRKMTDPKKRVAEVLLSIDPSNVDLIRERLCAGA